MVSLIPGMKRFHPSGWEPPGSFCSRSGKVEPVQGGVEDAGQLLDAVRHDNGAVGVFLAQPALAAVVGDAIYPTSSRRRSLRAGPRVHLGAPDPSCTVREKLTCICSAMLPRRTRSS